MVAAGDRPPHVLEEDSQGKTRDVWRSRVIPGLWFALVAWCVLFAVYIAYFYFSHPPQKWLELGIFNGGMNPWWLGVHFVGGFVILLLGPLQFVTVLRQRWPQVHRGIGYTYLVSVLLTVIGGLGYMAQWGTVGGPPMTVSFVLYGALFAMSGAMTLLRACQRNFRAHSEWALRLYALGVGSAIYRILTGLAYFDVVRNAVGSDGSLTWLTVAAFFFYVPNLIAAEAWIRLVLRHQPAPTPHTEPLIPPQTEGKTGPPDELP